MRTIILLALVATAGCGGTLASVKDHPSNPRRDHQSSLQVDFVAELNDKYQREAAEFKAVITSGNFTFFVQGKDADEFWAEFDIAVGDCTARYWVTSCHINGKPNPGRSILIRAKNHLLDLTGLEGYEIEIQQEGIEFSRVWTLDDFEAWPTVPEGKPVS